MTTSELSALVERIITKDGADIFTDLKQTAAWKRYCQSAMKVLDTSSGSSIDLAEFTSEFNLFNTNRFYYLIKHLVSEILNLLKKYSKDMNMSTDRLDEFQFGNKPTQDKESIALLQQTISDLNKKLEQVNNQLKGSQNQLGSLQKEYEDSVRETARSMKEKDVEIACLKGENDKLKRYIQDDVVEEWNGKFESVIEENNKLREVLENVKKEVIDQNVQFTRIREALDEEREKSAKANSTMTIVGAAMTDIQLDPFRTELVRQYGSFETAIKSFWGTRHRLTMTETESMCLSLGYSRDYCKKLFFALDTRNRGYLTMEQFARPLPVINNELCLLMKKVSESS